MADDVYSYRCIFIISAFIFCYILPALHKFFYNMDMISLEFPFIPPSHKNPHAAPGGINSDEIT